MESLDYRVVRSIHGEITSRTFRNSDLNNREYVLQNNKHMR